MQLAEVARGSGKHTADAWFSQVLLAKAPEYFRDSTPVSIAADFATHDAFQDVNMPDFARIQSDPPYITAALQCAIPVSIVKVKQKREALLTVSATSYAAASSTLLHSNDVTGCTQDRGELAGKPDHTTDNSASTRPVQVRKSGPPGTLTASQIGEVVGGLQWHGFSPGFPRPLPPICSQNTFETTAIQPSVSKSLMWDDSGEVAPACLAQLQQLLLDAQSKPLQPVQHKEFLLALVRRPSDASSTLGPSIHGRLLFFLIA